MTKEEAISIIEEYPEFREVKALYESTIMTIIGGKIEPSVTQTEQQWISCSEKLPENEQDVLLTVEVRPFRRIPYRRVVRAFYTDGKHTDADSAYSWDEFPDPQYDDKDNLIIPEGWWESSDYCEQQGMVDDFVIAWMPMPEPYKEKKMEKKLLTEIVTSVLTDRLCDGCKDTHSPYSYESCKGGSCDLCRSKAAEEVVAIINAQPETCVGCKHYGKWDNEVEYGYNSPCTNCRRRTADNYEQ